MSRRRRGFTMVEVLIVIGVMILLMAIGVIAYRGLDKMASERATHVAMDNGNSMIAEYEHGGTTATLYVYDPVNSTVAQNYPAANSTNFIDAQSNGTGPSKWDVSPSGTARVPCVQQSGYAIERLIRQPKNKQAFSGLPQKALIDQPSGGPSITPALADGWRNPMILAPAGGIKVTLDAGGSSARPVLITSPDHRPFWVSAGPDGDISKGDDNVYSFSK